MINRVLGLNESVLLQCSVAEQAAYRLASRLFLLALLISILGNACFGWLLLRNISGLAILALLMSFIHYSVLRISLITLMTRPLTEDDTKQKNPAEKAPGFLFSFFQHPLLKPVSWLRFVFAACIAVSVSMPLTSVIFYEDAMQAENEYRDAFQKSHTSELAADSVLTHDFMEAHYPFIIFRKLMQKPSCKLLFLLFCSLFFAPLLILSRLRHGAGFQYTRLLKAAMLKEVMLDYHETIEQMQHFLNRNYPQHQIRLHDLNAFADGPLRHQLKRDTQINFGDKKSFNDFLNTI